MDSRSRRLPSLPSLRSSYTSSPGLSSSSSTSSSLGSSRLYGRDPVLNHDRFPRTSSSYKADLDKQSSCLLGSSRDYGSSESRSASWKLPSSRTTPSRSYDCPWAESSLGSSSSSRTKLTDSEGRLGMRSVLLNATDDGDSKRAKLSYSNRGLYSRTPSSSVSPSTYSANGLSSGRGTCDKASDVLDSSRSSSRRLLSWSPSSSSSSSSSSKPLLSRRELETNNEPTLSSLRDRRMSSPGLTSSLYQTDRVTSTYAQGARPKETSYLSSSTSSSSSSSYSPSARDGSLSSRHLLSSAPHLIPLPLRDYSSRTSSRYSSSSSSALHTAPTQTGNPDSSSDLSSFSSPSAYSGRSSWYSAPPARAEARPPPRQAPEAPEPDSRRSTRHLLSRLFSRRSSQDSSSSSSSSSVRSLDEDSASPGGESADSDEGARTSEEARSRRADLAPIRESDGEALRGAPARPRRESGAGGGGGGSSWLSSSLRGRWPPLLARLQGYVRDENAHAAASSSSSTSTSAGPGVRHGSPQRRPRRWYTLEHGAPQDDDEEDEEEDEDDEDEDENEEEERDVAAAGAEAVAAAGGRRSPEDEQLPVLEDASVGFLLRRRAGLPEHLPTPTAPPTLRGAESQPDAQREKTPSARDEEKLRKIKERLLLEESDEEEGDLCRICQMGEESAANPLIQPCCCTGSLQYVHQDCIKRWLHSKIVSGTSFEAVTTCELCKEKLKLHMDNFDVQELYRTYVQSEYDEFICSGLYLVVLLHYCEQRFSDVLGAFDAAGFFSLLRIINEHMDSLEGNHGDSEAEGRDTRPSIDFSDLDDDLDDE